MKRGICRQQKPLNAMSAIKMTRKEFELKQCERREELWIDELKNGDSWTQLERDIWNLKYLKASIGCQSLFYRMGIMSSIDRILERLENGEQGSI